MLLVTEFQCCLKMTFECLHKLYYFMVSVENGLIVKPGSHSA